MVKVYVDTNVVVADAVETHIHNSNAAELFRQIKLHKWVPVISTHGISEIYAILTGTPFQRRISPSEAWQILQENVLTKFEVEPLSRHDYIKMIKDCAAQGWTSGSIYDALHIAIARKAHCSRIYTFNVKHFRQLAPDLHDRIMAP